MDKTNKRKILSMMPAAPGFRALYTFRNEADQIDFCDDPVIAWAAIDDAPDLAVAMVFNDGGWLEPAELTANFLQVLAPGAEINDEVRESAEIFMRSGSWNRVYEK